MKKKRVFLVLPITVLTVLFTTIFLFTQNYPIYLVIYSALLTFVTVFSAKHAIEVNAAVNWSFDDMEDDELGEVAIDILRDFAFYLQIYGVFFSVAYFVLYWLVTRLW